MHSQARESGSTEGDGMRNPEAGASSRSGFLWEAGIDGNAAAHATHGRREVLQEVGRQFGQFRALAFAKLDVGGQSLVAEPVHNEVEPV